jgi:hypothetical protein
MALSKMNCPVVIYNNVALGDIMVFKPESIPVYDDAGNMMYVEHTIRLESLLLGTKRPEDILIGGAVTAFPDYSKVNNTDELLHIARKRLTEPRRGLFIANTGWGNTIIEGEYEFNTSIAEIEEFIQENFDSLDEVGETVPDINQRDLNFGPLPTLLGFETLGERQTARVVWEIKFCTNECTLWNTSSSLSALGRLLAFSYTTEYDLDDMYLTTRTIRGKAKISNNTVAGSDASRAGLKMIERNIDGIRDTLLLGFAAPNEMKRTKQRFTMNDKRNELSFEITDQEIDSQEAYPNDVIEIEMDQNNASKFPFVDWKTEISGSITLAPGVPYVRAYTIFTTIVRDRFLRGVGSRTVLIEGESTSNGEVVYEQRDEDVYPIPLACSFTESVFRGRKRFNFSFSWKNIVEEPADIFALTGMYTSVASSQDYRWEYWKGSIGDLEINSRGYLGLSDEDGRFRLMVSPCDLIGSSVDNYAANHNSLFTLTSNPKLSPASADDPGVVPFLFKPAEPPGLIDSIIKSIMKIIKQTTNRSVEYEKQEVIDAPDVSTSPYNDDGTPKFSSEGSPELKDQGTGQNTRSIKRGSPSQTIVLVGKTKRLGGPAPAPKLTSIGGADVELIDEFYSDEIKSNIGEYPVHVSSYAQKYRVKGTSDGMGLNIEGNVKHVRS